MNRLLPWLGTTLLAAATVAAWMLVLPHLRTPPAPGDGGAAVAEGGPGSDAAGTPARRARPAIYYAAIAERPLFAPGRRPITAEPEAPVLVRAPEPAAPEEDGPPPLPRLRILGVVGSGDAREALIAADDGASVWLGPSAEIGGWTLRAVGPDWIDLSHGDVVTRVEMFER